MVSTVAFIHLGKGSHWDDASGTARKKEGTVKMERQSRSTSPGSILEPWGIGDRGRRKDRMNEFLLNYLTMGRNRFPIPLSEAASREGYHKKGAGGGFRSIDHTGDGRWTSVEG